MIESKKLNFLDNRESLTTSIIAKFCKHETIGNDQSLVEIGITDKKALLDFIYRQNPTPCLLLEAIIAMDNTVKTSSAFIGKPKKIETVGDIVSNVHGIMYFHDA